MISTDQIQSVLGNNVVDSSGDKIGKAGQVYLDDSTGQPAWVTVNTGLFGTSETFVPLDDATVTGSEIRVPYPKSQVKDAPRVGADGHIEPAEEEELYRYYNLHTSGVQTTQTTTQTDVRAAANTTDDAMTRSEERLHVGTQQVQAGKARLRKYIVTEQQTVTVPVSHDEVRVVREPITDANRGAALSGPDLTEEEHEVVLTEERAVVSKETVPVERVRLEKETVVEQQQVTESVRKEQIETDTTGVTTETTGTRTDASAGGVVGGLKDKVADAVDAVKDRNKR